MNDEVMSDPMMKKLLMMVLAITCMANAPAWAQDVMAPDVLAKSVTDDVLAVLRSDKDIQAGNTEEGGGPGREEGPAAFRFRAA